MSSFVDLTDPALCCVFNSKSARRSRTQILRGCSDSEPRVGPLPYEIRTLTTDYDLYDLTGRFSTGLREQCVLGVVAEGAGGRGEEEGGSKSDIAEYIYVYDIYTLNNYRNSNNTVTVREHIFQEAERKFFGSMKKISIQLFWLCPREICKFLPF